MKHLGKLSILLCVVLQLTGCGQGWGLEYSDSAAHFNEDAVLEKAKPYVGKKIVVKGIVTRQDLSNPENCKVYLGHSICCNMGDLQRMVKGCEVGDTIFVGGILKNCEEGNVLLEPAMKRDPKAEFNPVE